MNGRTPVMYFRYYQTYDCICSKWSMYYVLKFASICLLKIDAKHMVSFKDRLYETRMYFLKTYVEINIVL